MKQGRGGGDKGGSGRMVRNSFFQIWGDNFPTGGIIWQGGDNGAAGRMVRNSFSRFGGIICPRGGDDNSGGMVRNSFFPDLGG